MNSIFKDLLNEQVRLLKTSFEISEKLFRVNSGPNASDNLYHAGEFGVHKEEICKRFIEFIVPESFGVSSGFILTPNNQVSTQIDIVVYSKELTSLIQSKNNQKFFPIETVVAFGEVKSKLSKSKLKEALIKMGRTKSYFNEMKNVSIHRSNSKRVTDEFNPSINTNDQLFSFLICNSFGKSDINETYFEELYPTDYNQINKHNCLLSLDEGLLTYYIDKAKLEGYDDPDPKFINHSYYHYNPVFKNITLETTFVKAIESNSHIADFASSLYASVTKSTILYLDLINYLGRE